METLLQTYCFEIAVTCAEAREQSAYVRRMALHLGQYLAIYLAETITGLLQKVLTHPAQGLVDGGNVVEHGLRSKLLRSFQVNGSVLFVFKDWIRWMCCPGNGLTTMSA